MKSFLSLAALAIIATSLTGCSTCYTEGYQPLFDPHGFRATGMVDDPALAAYKQEDLHYMPAESSPDLLAPTLGLSPHFPPAPVVQEP